MVEVEVKEPRPGTGLKKTDLTRPGAQVTLVALTPEAGASMAVFKWSNPEKKCKVLNPHGMEVVALQELPLFEQKLGANREIDVAAVQAAIQAVLPPRGPTEDAPVFIYTKDSQQETGAILDEAAMTAVECSHRLLQEAVQGLPATSIGTVSLNAMSRSLGINSKTRKTSLAMATAKVVFPQARSRLRTDKDDVGLANALLVAAHVIGASVAKGTAPAQAAARAVSDNEPATAATPASGTVEEPGLRTPSAATGRIKRSQSGGSAAAAAAATGSLPAMSAAAARQAPAQAVRGTHPTVLVLPPFLGQPAGEAGLSQAQLAHVQPAQQLPALTFSQLAPEQQVRFLQHMHIMAALRDMYPPGTQFMLQGGPAGCLGGTPPDAAQQEQPQLQLPPLGLPPVTPGVLGFVMPGMSGMGGVGSMAGGGSSGTAQPDPYAYTGLTLPLVGPAHVSGVGAVSSAAYEGHQHQHQRQQQASVSQTTSEFAPLPKAEPADEQGQAQGEEQGPEEKRARMDGGGGSWGGTPPHQGGRSR